MTYREFFKLVEKHHAGSCQTVENGQIAFPGEPMRPMHALVIAGKDGDQPRRVPFPYPSQQGRDLPTAVARSYCVQLGIKPEEFGLPED